MDAGAQDGKDAEKKPKMYKKVPHPQGTSKADKCSSKESKNSQVVSGILFDNFSHYSLSIHGNHNMRDRRNTYML